MMNRFITRWVLRVVKIGVISDTHDDYKAIYKSGEVFRNAGVSAPSPSSELS